MIEFETYGNNEVLAVGNIFTTRPPVRRGRDKSIAADYESNLLNFGTSVVADVPGQDVGAPPAGYPPKGYEPQKTDVVIFPIFKGHDSGHMAMFDGKQWVSDFRQNGIWPNQKAAQKYGPSYTIYRFRSSQGR